MTTHPITADYMLQRLREISSTVAELIEQVTPAAPAGKPVRIADIQKRVAQHMGTPLADMFSQRRPERIVYARHLAMYLCRESTDETLAKIGEAFGGRDHGTVIHACNRVTDLISIQDKPTLAALKAIAPELMEGK